MRDILPHVEVVLTAHATDAVPQGAGNVASASGKHELNSRTISSDDGVDVIESDGKTYVIWQPQLHLARPRVRLQRPAIYLTANLTLGSAGQKASSQPKEQLLKSCEPLPANILEPLQADPALSNSNVYLSEARITKVAPKPLNLAELVKPIRGATKRAFPAMPALFTRIRYSTLPDAIIASLHLETPSVIAGTVRIISAQVDVLNTRIEDLTKTPLPLKTSSGDETILLYKLQPSENSKNPTISSQTPVSISIRAEASLDQGSHINLEIDWQAHIDLSNTWQKPTYHWSRPISTSSHRKTLSTQSIGKSSVDFAPGTNEGIEGGVTFNFTAPPTTHAFSEFKISVHCNNRSSRPRRFGLVVLQSIKPRSSVFSKSSLNVPESSSSFAKILQAPPTIERAKAPEVLDLNSDVRIGPLPAGACFETHLAFKALRTGVLDLGTLRIVDLDSRQTVEVRDLPDVIALEKIEEIG